MSIKWGFLFLFFFGITKAQNIKYNTQNLSLDSIIDGTLLLPKSNKKLPLAIIIQGSGPTDRNGNQSKLKNNSLKFLAEDLYKKDIASFRYDKRLVKLILNGTFNEIDADFNDFIKDAKIVLNYFKNDQRFSEIIIIGHSQGSLVGMIAAAEGADKFISIAGAGQEIDDVVINQLKAQAPNLVDNARQSFDDLRVNGVAQNYSSALASIFRPSIQPFMYSWMAYNPKTEIVKLDIPILIINGDNDFQVPVTEAQFLKEANSKAELVIIPNMNHVFREIKGNLLENQQSYYNPEMPIMKELSKTISTFIKQN